MRQDSPLNSEASRDGRCGLSRQQPSGRPPKTAPPARELEVRGDHEGLPLVALGYDLEEQPRPVGVEGRKPSSPVPRMSAFASWASSRSSDPASRARLRRMTSDDAVKNLAGRICWQHSEQIASSMWVLPVPTSPMSTRSSLAPPLEEREQSRSARPKPSGQARGCPVVAVERLRQEARTS